jgi:small acid-soluble spore protein L (minor)
MSGIIQTGNNMQGSDLNGGVSMSRHKNRGTKAPGVNPQGYGQDAELSEEPKSQLENAAKKTSKK